MKHLTYKYSIFVLVGIILLGGCQIYKNKSRLDRGGFFYSAKEKAEIKDVAKKYGKRIVFCDTCYGVKPSLKTIENELKAYADLRANEPKYPPFDKKKQEAASKRQKERARQMEGQKVGYTADEIAEINRLHRKYGLEPGIYETTFMPGQKVSMKEWEHHLKAQAATKEMVLMRESLMGLGCSTREQKIQQAKASALVLSRTEVKGHLLVASFTAQDFEEHQIPLSYYNEAIGHIHQLNTALERCDESNRMPPLFLKEMLAECRLFLCGIKVTNSLIDGE